MPNNTQRSNVWIQRKAFLLLLVLVALCILCEPIKAQPGPGDFNTTLVSELAGSPDFEYSPYKELDETLKGLVLAN